MCDRDVSHRVQAVLNAVDGSDGMVKPHGTWNPPSSTDKIKLYTKDPTLRSRDLVPPTASFLNGLTEPDYLKIDKVHDGNTNIEL